MASAEIDSSSSNTQEHQHQHQRQDPSHHHQQPHHHHRHHQQQQQVQQAPPRQHHHHHHKVHHHHHHHQPLLSAQHQSPPSSPFVARTESPALEMNKSSAPQSPGTGTPNASANGLNPAAAQSQVISRTGRAVPSISTAFQTSTARAPDSASGMRSATMNAAQVHHQSNSTQGAGPQSASTSHPHHHYHQQHPSSHQHHPSSNPSSALPSGFGGPITVAEALSNVNNHTGPTSSHPTPSANAAASPWSASAGGPMSAHPSNAVAGPSSHPSHAPLEAASTVNGMLDGRGGPGGPMGGPGGPNGHMMGGNPGGVAGGGGTTNEAHLLSLRAVIEHGSILNNEAAKETNFSIERRKNLPIILQNLETETELCYSEIGIIAWNLNDYAKAFKSFENALVRNPFCLISLQGLARFYHEKANGTNTNVNSLSSSLIGNSGGNANGISGGAGATVGGPGGGAINIEDNYNRVVDYASRSLAIDDSGHEGEMWSLIGHAFLQLGQMPRAYSCYQQAIAKAVKKDDPKLWYGIGILYDRYGSVEHAEEAFASVLKLDPNFHKREEVFFRLGIIYKLQGKADASLECFHYILARPPEPLKAVDVWYQIGHAHELKRDLSLAKDAYERVLSTTPDHSKVLQHLGGIYLRENTPFHNPQKCIDYISQSLEHDSTDPFSWYFLGRAFMQQNNHGKAYEAYQQAVYRDGKNPAYWCSIGVLYFNINQYHDALDAYTRAVRIHPFIPEIWQNLGILYESCHDQLADATDAYQRASQLDPANVELERRLKEVRNALRTGNEITTAPPPPQDIMPDSKSWQSVHMDVSGAKPVYLDSKSISQQPSPTLESGLGLSSLIQGRYPPGSSATGLTGPLHHRGSPQSGPVILGMPPSASSLEPGGPQDIANGRRRSSFTRPDSSHAHYGPPYPGQYLDETLRSRHAPTGPPGTHLLGGQHGVAMASRPSVHSHASTSSGQHDIDRDGMQLPPRGGARGSRMAGSSARSSAYPNDRHSPHSMQDPAFRHAISPSNSPRMAAAEHLQGGDHSMYERERQVRKVEVEREEQRLGSRAGMQQQQQQQQRRPPPTYGGSAHSPTDARTSAAYGQRDYPPGSSRRLGSPPAGPGPRYPEERPTPGRRVSGSSRPNQPPGYPYEYHANGPPGYPDPRRDPRFIHDPRYDYAEVAAVERERMQAERDRQSRRPPPLSMAGGNDPAAEEERRRRETERNGGVGIIRNGRRDMSPIDLIDARERERDLRRPPPPNDQPGSLPSMRTAAPARGPPGGHHPSHQDQARRSLDNGQKASADRRKPYRHPDMPAEGPQGHQQPYRQPEQSFDDETDMANALIGLSGGAPGSDAPPPLASSRGGAYRAGEKRPLSSHEDSPFKKARGQDDAA